MPNPLTAPPVLFDIEVTGNEQLLWRGSLRASARAAASYAHQREEAEPANCPVQERWNRSGRTSLELKVVMRDVRPGNEKLAVDVEWVRPSSQTGCNDAGSRTVKLQETVDITDRQDLVVRGDAGLTVRLKRR